QDVVGAGPHGVVVPAAEERQQQDVFGFEDGVALEFADPVAVGPLQAEQGAAGVVDGGAQPAGSRRGGAGRGRGQSLHGGIPSRTRGAALVPRVYPWAMWAGKSNCAGRARLGGPAAAVNPVAPAGCAG